MKVNKKLSAAITLSLMLGVYGSASAADSLYGSKSDAAHRVVDSSIVSSGNATTEFEEKILTGADYTLISGSWENVFGGYSGAFGQSPDADKDIYGNTVSINGIDAANKVEIGDSIEDRVSGGESYYGAAYNNKVGTATNAATNFIATSVMGGRGYDDTSENEVYLGTGAKVTGDVYGGLSDHESALENKVVIGAGVEVNGKVSGGSSAGGQSPKGPRGLAQGNVVSISEGATINTVYGGKVGFYHEGTKRSYGEGEALNNIVNISGGSITETVYGGHTENGAVNNNKVGTVDNLATNFTADGLFGGYGTTGAEGNEVYLGTGANVKRDVFGGYTESGNATGNSVSLKGTGTNDPHVVWEVYGGAVSHSGTGIAQNNKVGFINDSGELEAATNFIVRDVYGGDGATGAQDNKVWLGVGGGAGYVYGGNTSAGDATRNKATITGSDFIASAYGGCISSTGATGNATSNEVEITGTDVGEKVFGGVSANGNATSNKVTITDSIVGSEGTNLFGYVYGGYVNGNGDAASNEVTISGNSEITNQVYGGYVRDSGDVTGNTVSINGGDTETTKIIIGTYNSAGKLRNGGQVYGGKSEKGTANNNKVGTADNAASNFTSGTIYGGRATAGADGNEVHLGKSVVVNGGVYGACNDNGIANGNIVCINGGASAAEKVQIDSFVYGGISYGDATSNKIGTAEKLATYFAAENIFAGVADAYAEQNEVHLGAGVSSAYNVIGGQGASGAENNIVNINGGTDDATKVKIGTVGTSGEYANNSGYVYGGQSAGGAATGNKVGTADNAATNFTAKYVYGGQGATGADSNAVYLGDGATVNGTVYGGKTTSGDAQSNTITLEGGTVNGLTGGMTDNGNAIQNVITINGGAVNDTIIYGGHAMGSDDETGIANGNKVIITGADKNDMGISKIAGFVYGGMGENQAVNNVVEVSGVNTSNLFVNGGSAIEGEASGNSVTVSGAATSIGGATGGSTGGSLSEGFVYSNTVQIIEGAEVASAIGGTTSIGTVGAEGKGNKVIVDGGTVAVLVYGGEAQYAGDVSYNEVEIVSGTIGNADPENGMVYGGHTTIGDANKNAVEVSGGTVKRSAFGGYTLKGDAVDNTMTVTGGEITESAYGGLTEDGVASGNTITVDGGTVGEYAIGATSKLGNADNNIATIKSGTVGNLYGASSNGDGEKLLTYNKAIVKGGEVTENVVGAISDAADVMNNTATLEDGTVKNIIGAYSMTDGDANLNTVNIKGGTVTEAIHGGWAVNGVANNNVVNISGDADTSAADVYGGVGASGSGNTLNIDAWSGKAMNSINDFQTINIKDTKDIKVGDVDGLKDGDVDLKINYADLDNEIASLTKVGDEIVFIETQSGDALDAKIASAKLNDKYESGQGEWRTNTEGFGVEATKIEFQINEKKAFLGLTENLLTGNLVDEGVTEDLVLDTGASAYDKIYGAYSDKGTATAATVNVDVDDADLSSSTIYGNNVSSAGNVLNVKANGVKVGGIEKFESMNFYIPKDAAAGDKLLSVNSDVYLTDVKVAAGFHNDTTLAYGDKVILIAAPSVSGMDGVSEVKVDDTDFTEYDVMVYQGDAGMNQVESGTATTLVAEMANMELKENSKVLLETVMAEASLINDGSDMLAGAGMDSAASAIAADLRNGAPSGSMSIFGAVSGNKAKLKTGSHVDANGWNFNIGLAKELKNKDGKMILAPVVEYGRGEYDSYLDNGYHGEGNAHFVGGGVMAKQINNNGSYFEGSVRAGKVSSEFKSTGGNYDSDAKYVAGHIGLGHIQKLNEKNSMDYYAKFFHTHISDDDVKVNAKGKDLALDLDSMTSSRLRIGGRLTHQMGEKNAFYFGLAYQREFNGSASGTLQDKDIVAPSMKGDTGFMEIGVKLFDASKYDIDLGGFGSVGKKKGAGFNLNFNWKF